MAGCQTAKTAVVLLFLSGPRTSALFKNNLRDVLGATGGGRDLSRLRLGDGLQRGPPSRSHPFLMHFLPRFEAFIKADGAAMRDREAFQLAFTAKKDLSGRRLREEAKKSMT